MPSILVIDNLDSFTFTLVDYLRTLGAEVRVARSSVWSVGDAMRSPADGFVISPGPGAPEQAGISVDLARSCMAERRPLLGVCLGHQAIALAAGAEVGRDRPVHGKAVEVRHDGSGLFAGLPSPMKVARYNSLVANSLPAYLHANAWGTDGSIQGLRHEAAPVHGVQFHPESIASEHGRTLLSAFLRLCS